MNVFLLLKQSCDEAGGHQHSPSKAIRLQDCKTATMNEKCFKLDPKDDVLILRAEEGDDSSMDTEPAEDSKSSEPSASFSPHKHHPPRNMAL